MSPTLKWTDQLKLGIDEMDDQHFELITRVNRLIIAHSEDENQEVIESLLGFLKSYVVEHFGAEEHLQRQYHYPDYDAHRQAHFEFVQMVGQFEKQYKNTKQCTMDGECKSLLYKINTELVEWLTHHIGETDRDVADHIKHVLEPVQNQE